MPDTFEKLPDVDSITGIGVEGQIVDIQYVRSSGERYSLQMTLPNALYLLVLLAHVPGAKEALRKSDEFDKKQGR